MLSSFGHFAKISLAKQRKAMCFMYLVFSSEHPDPLPREVVVWAGRVRPGTLWRSVPLVWSAVVRVIWTKGHIERLKPIPQAGSSLREGEDQKAV